MFPSANSDERVIEQMIKLYLLFDERSCPAGYEQVETAFVQFAMYHLYRSRHQVKPHAREAPRHSLDDRCNEGRGEQRTAPDPDTPCGRIVEEFDVLKSLMKIVEHRG